jgi:hypothetical protein
MRTLEREKTTVSAESLLPAQPTRPRMLDRDRRTIDAIVRPAMAAIDKPQPARTDRWLLRRLPLIVPGLAVLMCAIVVTIDSII